MLKTFKYWILAIRPKTLPASIAPVLIGTAMAYGDGVHHFPSALAALIGAMLIQVGTNLANDYFDFKKGVDTSDRIGPVRVTQAGLIPPVAVKWGFIICFALAALVSSYLIARAGMPIVWIGIASIASGILYTASPWSLASLGLGELFVLLFFGPVAVAGTYYVQSFEWNGAVILAGLSCGFFSTAILAVNNLRDLATDRKANKKTLAVRWGASFARMEYLFCILAACLMPLAVYFITGENKRLLGASSVIFLMIPVIHDVFTSGDGPLLNKALATTGIFLLIYAFTFSILWNI